MPSCIRLTTVGVGACSSDDMQQWRFEGIVLHGVNVTDSVHGLYPGTLALQQPRVLKGNSSIAGASPYVMWGVIEDSSRMLGMAGVATADHPGGPFHFRRSFYPDGNETHDQTVYTSADGSSYVARTYYATTEYVLPTPVMQPVWEAVKAADNSTDYGLSYHRAFYSKDYDDYHDIYLQRWRLEDVPWEIVILASMLPNTRITFAYVIVLLGTAVACTAPRCCWCSSNTIALTVTLTLVLLLSLYTHSLQQVVRGQLDATGAYCTEPDEYKIIIGQGDPV
eukprot:2350-Heterococcus_DN1.PRE.1